MINFVLKNLVNILLPMISADIIKKGLDAFFDVIEDAVEKSKTQVDDIVVLPIIKLLRNALDVPDNDNKNN